MISHDFVRSCQRELVKVAKKEKSKPDEMRLWKGLHKKTKVPIKSLKLDIDSRLLGALGPHVSRQDGKLTIRVNKPGSEGLPDFLDPVAMLAHEIGHTEVDKTMIGRMAQSLPVHMATDKAKTVALFANMLASTPKGKQLALALPLAATVPTLGTEAAASIKGYKMLKDMNATDEELKKYRKALATAWLTYTTIPLGVAAAAVAGRVAGYAVRRGMSI